MRLHRSLTLPIVLALVASACGTAAPSGSLSEPGATVAPTASASAAPTAAPTLAPTPTPTLAPTAAPTPTLAPTVAPSPTPGALGLKLACQILTKAVALAIVGKGSVDYSYGDVVVDGPETRQSKCQRSVKTAPLTGVTINIDVYGALTQLGRVGVQGGFDYFTKDGGEVVPDMGSKAFFTTDVRALWVISDDGAYLLSVRYGRSSKAECIQAAKVILANL